MFGNNPEPRHWIKVSKIQFFFIILALVSDKIKVEKSKLGIAAVNIK